MFCLNDTMRYHLCPGRADMRKGIDSLIGVVKEHMGADVRNGDVFIFIGSSRRLMKLLHAEDGGMETEILHYSERTLIGKAVTYAYTHWDNMMRVLEDGRLKLDYNFHNE